MHQTLLFQSIIHVDEMPVQVLLILLQLLDIGTITWYFYLMNSKNKATLKVIFENPVRSGIKWTDIEALFTSLGAKISEGNGSRVRVELNGERAVFHRPHPENTTDKGAVKSVRRFLANAEVDEDEL